MTVFRSVLATSARVAGALLAGLTAASSPAAAAVNDPMQLLYFISGIRDSGGAAQTGVGTAVHCSNWSGATQRIQYVFFQFNGTVATNNTADIAHAGTITTVTKLMAVYPADLSVNTGAVRGMVAILATHKDLVCTAMVVDAAASTPTFAVTLHGVRYNRIASTEE
jgi:hypothetical protein